MQISNIKYLQKMLHLFFFYIIRYLNESSSVESISAKLRQVCPSIYHSEDAACAKVSIKI